MRLVLLPRRHQGHILDSRLRQPKHPRPAHSFRRADIGARGSGLGSWAGGLIHDWTHTYNLLFAFALVNVVLGLIPFLMVPALRR